MPKYSSCFLLFANRTFLLFILCFLCQSVATVAQTEKKNFAANDSVRVDSVYPQTGIKANIRKTSNFIKRLIRSFDDFDKSYIEPNHYNYAFMLQNTNFYQRYTLKGTDEDGKTQSIQLSPRGAFKIGPYFGWRWLFLGYTFDVARPKEAGKATEFNLSLYSSMVGIDFLYVKNSGDFTIEKISGFEGVTNNEVKGLTTNCMNTYTLGINAYYVFNHKHFSYPAAFSQSTVQRRSAGSWMLGFRYDKQHISFDHTSLPKILLGETNEEGIIDELKSTELNYQNYSVSFGYAYNWVFAHNFLLSGSVSPSMGFKVAKGEKLTTDEVWMNVKNLNIDFISRVGLVWNNTHWYAGASYISHLYDYRRGRFSLVNAINYLNIYVGFNFIRRKKN